MTGPQNSTPLSGSVADWLASLSEHERERELLALAPTAEDLRVLEFSWRFWGRPKQFAPPGAWVVWLILAGRGFGKSRTGAEWVRDEIESGRRKRLALVGRTAADVRDVMVEGESGILAVSPPWFRPKYEPSKRRLTWPNGAIATTYSGEEPDALRGPQHDGAWCDEIAAWKYAEEAWDQLQYGLRLGDEPRVVATTTPRPTRIIRDLIKRAELDGRDVRLTRGTTFENTTNLAPTFVKRIISKYDGTRQGRQELYAEVIDDIQGALWKRAQLDELRVRLPPPVAEDVDHVRSPSEYIADIIREFTVTRIVVSVDPATTANKNSNETGIIVVGVGAQGHGYVLADLSGKYSPDEWARKAVGAFNDWNADAVIAETNQGGDLVESNLRTVDRNIRVKQVRATRGKWVRAEPISGLYEQGRVHHVGSFSKLEDQQCTWVPGDAPAPVTEDDDDASASPDRLDALVWGLTYLMVVRDPNRKPRPARGGVTALDSNGTNLDPLG